MKKVLSLFAILSVITLIAPEVQAAPPPHAGGPHGGNHISAGQSRGYHKPPHGGMVMAGHHHRPPHGGHWGPPPPRGHYHRGGILLGGVLARRSYWNDPYYGYRLGWYDDYYYPTYTPVTPYYRNGVYLNFGIPIRF